MAEEPLDGGYIYYKSYTSLLQWASLLLRWALLQWTSHRHSIGTAWLVGALYNEWEFIASSVSPVRLGKKVHDDGDGGYDLV